MTDTGVSLATIHKRLTELKLAGMKKTLEIRLQQAGSDSMSYTEFVSLLLEDELLNRQDNRRRDLHKHAHFPFEKGMEDFDLPSNPHSKNGTCWNLQLAIF